MSQYAKVVSPQREDFEVKDSGLVINPSYPHLGASPDGFVSCRCCGLGTLEIKCPYCVKNQSSENFVEMLTYLETEGDNIHLKETDAYFYQVQAQLNICEVEYGDFVVWTENDTFVERISVKKEFFIETVQKIEEFYKYSILPDLLGKWYTKQPVLPMSKDITPSDDTLVSPICSDTAASAISGVLDPISSDVGPVASSSSDITTDRAAMTTTGDIEPDGILSTSSDYMASSVPGSNSDDNLDVSPVELWCYCRKPDDSSEDMITCDYPSCPIEWFHKCCLRLRSFPKGKWYCPDCRKKFKGKHPSKPTRN